MVFHTCAQSTHLRRASYIAQHTKNQACKSLMPFAYLAT